MEGRRTKLVLDALSVAGFVIVTSISIASIVSVPSKTALGALISKGPAVVFVFLNVIELYVDLFSTRTAKQLWGACSVVFDIIYFLYLYLTTVFTYDCPGGETIEDTREATTRVFQYIFLSNVWVVFVFTLLTISSTYHSEIRVLSILPPLGAAVQLSWFQRSKRWEERGMVLALLVILWALPALFAEAVLSLPLCLFFFLSARLRGPSGRLTPVGRAICAFTPAMSVSIAYFAMVYVQGSEAGFHEAHAALISALFSSARENEFTNSTTPDVSSFTSCTQRINEAAETTLVVQEVLLPLGFVLLNPIIKVTAMEKLTPFRLNDRGVRLPLHSMAAKSESIQVESSGRSVATSASSDRS